MFFVLSGFLIIRYVYIAKMKDVFSISDFYKRRALRILPLYFLIVFFGLFFYNILLPVLNIPFEINYTFLDVFWIFLFPNIFAIDYSPGGILEVLWSIGIEEQFYLIIAPLMAFVKNKKVVITLLFITVLYFVVFHLDYFDFLKKYKFVYFFLLFGGVIGILEEQRKLQFLKKSKWFSIIIVLLTFLYFTSNVLNFDSSLLKNITALILFSLFIHTIGCNNLGFIVKNKALNYFGTISYGIYMYHVIALNTVVFIFLQLRKNIIFNDIVTIVLIFIFTIGLTLIISHISYKYFESYFLNLKNKYR